MTCLSSYLLSNNSHAVLSDLYAARKSSFEKRSQSSAAYTEFQQDAAAMFYNTTRLSTHSLEANYPAAQGHTSLSLITL